ncbi:hypothetical protein GCM10007231_25070 [Nocardioides daphniae]|uniref:Uncharacterized protein n=1 Tax=Nocardioides daphniae TaxID=402297 RepID=A0ABQ1QG18_9ACTN|nr:hypothetical protein GCM10007231_25070 [Nocardioides daphniae]
MPRAVQVVTGEEVVDRQRLPFEAAATQHRPGGHGRDRRVQDGPTSGAPFETDPQRGASPHEHCRVRNAPWARVGVQASFETAGNRAEGGDRVAPARVAEEPVGREPEEESRCPGEGQR